MTLPFIFPRRLWSGLALVFALLFTAGCAVVPVPVVVTDQGILIPLPGAAAVEETHDHDHEDHDHEEEAHDHDHDHDMTEGGALKDRRLLVADSQSGLVQVFDPNTGEEIAHFDLAGAARVYTTEDERYAFAVQTEADAVNVIDGGVWIENHGDHMHPYTQDPALLALTMTGPTPIHFVDHDGLTAIFFDGDGTTQVIDRATLAGEGEILSFDSGKPHHGVGFAVAGKVIVSTPEPGDGALPIGVDVYSMDGELLQSFHDCPGLHGETALGALIAFGCRDGVLIIDTSSEEFTSQKIANPADAGDRRVGTLIAHADLPFFIGNFAADGLAWIDPVAGTLTPLILPLAQAGFKFDTHGDHLVVLTVDGQIHTLDPMTGEIGNSAAVVTPIDPEAPRGSPRPVLAVDNGVAFVSDHTTGEVHVVDLETLTVQLTFASDGIPLSMTTVGIPAAEEEHDHDHEAEAHDHADHDHTAALDLPVWGGAAEAAGHLLVADPADGGITVYALADGTAVAEIADVYMDGHAGFVALPDGRVLLADNVARELVVLDLGGDTPSIAGRASLPGSAVHFAVDEAQTFAVVSTAPDFESGEGETTLTHIDLSTLAVTSAPIESGEPGVLVGDGVILHRDGGPIGRLESFAVDGFSAESAPANFIDIGAYGHGEAFIDGHAYVATDDGVDVVHVDGTDLSYEALIPWNVSDREGGRAYYMRTAPNGGYLWSYLRIVDESAVDAWENWQDWQNDLYVVDLAATEATRLELGPGLVYRMALTDKLALLVRLHPDGDVAHFIDADPASETFLTEIAAVTLPPTGDAPEAGVEPWDAAGQRIPALSADSRWAFVTSGGDGAVVVIDVEAQAVTGMIEAPTHLDGGGYLLVVEPGAPLVDRVGR